MEEVEILRWGVGVLSALATGIGAALIAVIVWYAKRVIESIDALKVQVSNFDRRIIVLEAQQQPRVRYRAPDRRHTSAGAS